MTGGFDCFTRCTSMLLKLWHPCTLSISTPLSPSFLVLLWFLLCLWKSPHYLLTLLLGDAHWTMNQKEFFAAYLFSAQPLAPAQELMGLLISPDEIRRTFVRVKSERWKTKTLIKNKGNLVIIWLRGEKKTLPVDTAKMFIEHTALSAGVPPNQETQTNKRVVFLYTYLHFEMFLQCKVTDGKRSPWNKRKTLKECNGQHDIWNVLYPPKTKTSSPGSHWASFESCAILPRALTARRTALLGGLGRRI